MLWFDILFAWPEELLSAPTGDLASSSRIAHLIRTQNYLEAERSLLAHASQGSEAHSHIAEHNLLRSYFQLVRGAYIQAAHLIQATRFLQHEYQAFAHLLQAQLWLKQPDQYSAPFDDPYFWSVGSSWQPLLVTRATVSLKLGNINESYSILQSIPEPHILEAVRLRAALLLRSGKHEHAINCLRGAVERFPFHLKLQSQYINTLLEARSQDLTLPALRSALSVHGEEPSLLGAACAIKLLQRQPSLARRASLLQRLWPDAVTDDIARASNCLVAFEQCGHSSWLQYISPSILATLASNLSVQENRCLQLASAQSPFVREQVSVVLDLYKANPISTSTALTTPASLSSGRPLRIGWLSGDICHHPVSRFLLSFLEARRLSGSYEHYLVNLADHGRESIIDKFNTCPSLAIVDCSSRDLSTKLNIVRDVQLDVAVDLSGWTGGHFMRGFLEQLAFLQLNYLGYFASSGLPTMDAWIGDQSLFPSPMSEWHSEMIFRLPRCFIAWQPSHHFDESRAFVCEAPSSSGIRFGCFNHNRKLSDDVLRLWGQLLTAIPGSSLVLKANASTDPYTQTLLVRRMRRARLDPERVIWLPLAPNHLEHLQQYMQMDVALDSFPNGGCTTTCEALWMGVPVITLTGTHYVSRMSTAVLHGAGLGHWCASSPQEYLQLAREQADGLAVLRATRDQWRTQVINNPLGDAADLMRHLEQAFSQLYANKLAAQAS